MSNEIEKKEEMAVAPKAQDLSTMDGMFRFAQGISKSELVPQHFRNKPMNCFLALQVADRMRADIFAVMQNLYVVHGTPAFSAKFLIGLANRSGVFKTPIIFKFTGEGDTLEAEAYAIHASTDERVSYSFSMKDAIAEGYTKNPKYKSMPKLMLAYRAATLFTRLYCPETALGMMSVEEVEDVVAVRGSVGPAAYEPMQPDEETLETLATGVGVSLEGTQPENAQKPDTAAPAEPPKKADKPEKPKPTESGRAIKGGELKINDL